MNIDKKQMKKIFKIIGLSLLILIIFRGFTYRLLISYTEIGVRSEIKLTNEQLLKIIDTESANTNIDLKSLVKIANTVTCDKLRFTSNSTSIDPNELTITNQANCVGYSAMFNSTANYLIKKNNLNNHFEAKHCVGKLDFLGVDLHQFFHSKFFKDHDFNVIINTRTREIIPVDPSIYDYLLINEVTMN
ncbi:MAG: hypothetical protein ACJA0Q_001185 [Saprospiraceae bacterium]